ncbi:hypothetical protein ACIKT0_00945 [Hansschlegelia beijingensis]|uniref:hypothetical protein n=1 Tax=Hansschlegelia beijingensis TaxID=1133344 RepID=UPI00387EF92D
MILKNFLGLRASTERRSEAARHMIAPFGAGPSGDLARWRQGLTELAGVIIVRAMNAAGRADATNRIVINCA